MAKRIFEDRVPKLDDVPEADRPFYVEDKDQGGFVLADPSGLLKNNRDLKAEKIAITEAKAKLDTDIAKYTALGDVETLTKLKAKQKEIEEAQVTNNTQLDEFKRTFSATKDAETAAEREKRVRLESQYEREKVDTAIIAALVAAGATAEGLEYLPKVLRGDLKVFWENGVPVVKVVDSKGEPKRNDQLDLMKIDELVGEHKKKVGHFFRSSGGSGGGAPGGEPVDASEFDKKPSKWSDKKVALYIGRFGHDSYRQLCLAESQTAPA